MTQNSEHYLASDAPRGPRVAFGRPEHSTLADAVKTIHGDISSGMLFSEACARQPDLFDPVFIAAAKTGEKTGDPAGMLEHYARYLERSISLRKRVIQGLAYPVRRCSTRLACWAVRGRTVSSSE